MRNGFNFHGTSISSSCGLDSVLTSLYVRWKYEGLTWEHLVSVMDMMDKEGDNVRQ
jgi:hypothetical protein